MPERTSFYALSVGLEITTVRNSSLVKSFRFLCPLSRARDNDGRGVDRGLTCGDGSGCEHQPGRPESSQADGGHRLPIMAMTCRNTAASTAGAERLRWKVCTGHLGRPGTAPGSADDPVGRTLFDHSGPPAASTRALGDPQHLGDPAPGEAQLGQRHRGEVAQTSVVRGVAEQHRCPNGDEHLPVDLAAVQVAWRGHAHQHGLHRRPDRHPTIVSSLNIFRRDTPSTNTQVTALQRGYLSCLLYTSDAA